MLIVNLSVANLVASIQSLPIYTASIWLIVCAAVYSLAQELFAFDKNQPKIRKDAYVDVIYWLASPLAFTSITLGLTLLGFYIIFGGNLTAAGEFSRNGADWVKAMPFWAQLIAVMILQDISLYATHRLFHGGRFWKYHAIHHGAQNLDWLHSVRFHPINVICHSVFANALALWVGFTPASLVALMPFNTLYSAMVHANLNWTFGPFKYVLASPVFHRWHHTGPDEGGNMNFAATFPILDVIFGTFYMPKDKLPGPTGIYEDYVPKTIVGQLIFPFSGKSKGI